MQKHLRCKKVRPSKVESYLEVKCMKRLATTRSDIRIRPRGFLILNTLILYTGHIIASYCFQSLIGLPNICLQPYPVTKFIL